MSLKHQGKWEETASMLLSRQGGREVLPLLLSFSHHGGRRSPSSSSESSVHFVMANQVHQWAPNPLRSSGAGGPAGPTPGAARGNAGFGCRFRPGFSRLIRTVPARPHLFQLTGSVDARCGKRGPKISSTRAVVWSLDTTLFSSLGSGPQFR